MVHDSTVVLYYCYITGFGLNSFKTVALVFNYDLIFIQRGEDGAWIYK